MVKIDTKDITTITGKQSPEALPSWVNQAEKIINGINQLFDNYYAITGKKPVSNNPVNTENKLPFSEARELKKAEVKNKVEVLNMPDHFKELLFGFIKTTAQLQQLGYGEKLVGEAIYELPVNINQAANFLIKLWQKHYPDEAL